MAKLSIVAGATSQSVNIFVQASNSTTGAGLTGLVFNTSGLTAYYTFTGANAVATAITLATLAAVGSAFSSGGFKEIDSTNMPGVYRLDLPNAALASAKGRSVLVYLQGAANMAPCVLEVELTGWDNQDAVRGGLTALPNAAAEAAGGLYTRGSGAGQINQPANGQIDANAVKVGGTVQTGRDIGASVLLSAGTGTGQLDFTSGVVKGNLSQILGTALTETAGLLAGGFKKFFNVVAPTLTCLGVDQTGDSYARLGAPAGASHAADVAAVKSDTGAVKTQTDKLTFTVANQVDSNVLDWKSSAAPAMTGDAFARLGAPTGASVSADVAAVNAKTTNLPGSPAAVGSQMDLVNAPNATALNAIADSFLKRDWTAIAGEAAHSALNALRFLRNKWSVSAGTLIVTKEDGATTAWQGSVSTDAAAQPVTGNMPTT